MLLLCLTAPLITVAQVDSVSLSSLFQSWKMSHGYYVAYDAAKMNTLHLPQSAQKASPQAIMTLLQEKFRLCFTPQDSTHFLLHPCPPELWDLQGEVMDASTRERLPFAAIQIVGTTSGTNTDESGRFFLKDLSTATLQLYVRYIGYAPDTLSVKRDQKKINISLSPKAYKIKDVKITSLMDMVEVEENFGHLSIETQRLNSLPSITGPDPLNSLRLLPGIQGNPEGGSGLVMRGSKFDQTMILFDEMPLLHLDHFFGLFSSVNIHSIKDVRVFRSGYSAKYSGFTGGMIQITAKDGDLNKVSGGIDIDQFTTGIHLQVPIIKNKWSTSLTYRMDNSFIGPRIWGELVTGRLLEQRVRASVPLVGDEAYENAFYYFQDFTAKTVIRPNEKNKISLSAQHSRDNILNSIQHSDTTELYYLNLDFFSKWDNTALSLDWDRDLGNGLKGKAKLSTSWFNSATQFDTLIEFREGDTLRFLQNYFHDNLYLQSRFRYDMEKEVSASRKWYFGVDVPFIFSNLSVALDFDPEDDEFEADSFFVGQATFIPALYAEHKWQIKRWDLTTGLRIAWDIRYKTPRIEPRIFVSKKLSAKFNWRFNYGMYSQNAQQFLPAIREGLIPNYWLLSDSENSPQQWSQVATSGINFQHNGWLLDAELYYKNIQNTTEQFPALSRFHSGRNDILSAFFNGQSNVFGGDVMISKRYPFLSLWASGGYNLTRNFSPRFISYNYQPPYASALNVKTGLLFSIKNIDFGLTWYLQSGRRFTTLTDLTPLPDLEFSNATLPVYHRMDASLSYKFKFKRFSGSIQNSVFNIYNRTNTHSVQYTKNSGGLPQRVDSYSLGFIYNVRISLQWN